MKTISIFSKLDYTKVNLCWINKIILLILVLCLNYFTFQSCFAQDVIVHKNGDTIRCAIISIDSSMIKFRIKTNDVHQIVSSINMADITYYQYNYFTDNLETNRTSTTFLNNRKSFIDFGIGLGSGFELELGLFFKLKNNVFLGYRLSPTFMFYPPNMKLREGAIAKKLDDNIVLDDVTIGDAESFIIGEHSLNIISFNYLPNKEYLFMKQLGIGFYGLSLGEITYSFVHPESGNTVERYWHSNEVRDFIGYGINIGAGLYHYNNEKNWRAIAILPCLRLVYVNNQIVPYLTINFCSYINFGQLAKTKSANLY